MRFIIARHSSALSKPTLATKDSNSGSLTDSKSAASSHSRAVLNFATPV
jgi:hypothetical protein